MKYIIRIFCIMENSTALLPKENTVTEMKTNSEYSFEVPIYNSIWEYNSMHVGIWYFQIAKILKLSVKPNVIW